MKAMILAAGLGTRLRPLTNTRPKALIEIKGKPLLSIVIEKLAAAGVTDIIINLHHRAQQIVDFMQNNRDFGLNIEFSYEETILDTGGALKKAAGFFSDDNPFFLHNTDILTDFELGDIMASHWQSDALVTVAVNHRDTDRALLFDRDGLYGWQSRSRDQKIIARQPGEKTDVFGFCGIHVISPDIFRMMPEENIFSIIDCYLHLAGEGQVILPCSLDGYTWYDAGKPDILNVLNAGTTPGLPAR